MSLLRALSLHLRPTAFGLSLWLVTAAVLLATVGPAAVRPAAAASQRSAAAARAAAAHTVAARAAAIKQRLVAGTRRLEATQAQLAAALRRLQQARDAQLKAGQAVAQATAGLNAYAAAAYRESTASELSVLLHLSRKDPQDALVAAEYLDRAGSFRSEMLTSLRKAEARAASAGAQAEQARRRAVETQQRVFEQVANLQAAAATAGAFLSGSGAASRARVRRPLPATDLASLAAAGYPNGLIPASALCRAGVKAEVLRCDAAIAFRKLAQAYAAAFRRPICHRLLPQLCGADGGLFAAAVAGRGTRKQQPRLGSRGGPLRRAANRR